MTNVVAAAIEYAGRHQDATPATVWHVRFLDDETRTGTLEHVEDDIFALVKGGGDTYYFDAAKVLFMKIK